MKKIASLLLPALFFFLLVTENLVAQIKTGRSQSFNSGWKFFLGDDPAASASSFNDAAWRSLNLPHDWSIELPFDKDSPVGTGGGALSGGIGWYRKSFTMPESTKGKLVSIVFDGVYRNSEVWINGHYLGKRPYGYSSFQYDLTPYLVYGAEKNVIAVKADNSQQPNSRWYSGSGIYRNVWLRTTDKLHVIYNGTYITTPAVSSASAKINLQVRVEVPGDKKQTITAVTTIFTKDGQAVAKKISPVPYILEAPVTLSQSFEITNPVLWSVEKPYLYKAVTQLLSSGKVADEYTTPFGIRYFTFDTDKGFLLNGKRVKILGVCDHHDLGCLGAAINKAALRRQLRILKEMGCNGIRTSHNPPAPELLDLCDEMGFIVMDEAFDMWKKEKTTYDYHLDWDEWHKKDLQDQVTRDRNHPCVFIWSIGNEIVEQWDKKDSAGTIIARELAGIVRSLDTTRPITSACNSPYPDNAIIRSGALDLIGYNYDHKDYASFHQRFPGKKFIATETTSALETRGHYDMPSDSIRRWPSRWDKPLENANADLTCSAYDNCSAPWGSTHEETWKVLKKYDFLSGMYIWTGFDYIGEPTPYPWPARSSYFGIIDLAGFPKDVYYMYQSEWTNKTVLHVFPGWNPARGASGWKQGDRVDVWAYYNNADEVELFLNGKSLGIKKKTGDDLHVVWQVKYEPGTIKAVSRKNGKVVLTKEIKTSGQPAKIVLTADRKNIKADGSDLSFITATITDANGNIVPDANNLIHFEISGEGFIAGTDNGSETDLTSFKSSQHAAFNGLCLAVVQAKQKAGAIRLKAVSEGLQTGDIMIGVK
ncbi:MAG: beta-galactosidase GalB [Bacteroidota bacterium]|nr:beta-galactosidase GalB [Bacteroidota bacterium]